MQQHAHPTTSGDEPRPRFRRAAQLGLAIGLFFAALGPLSAGCGGESPTTGTGGSATTGTGGSATTGPGKCEGGIIRNGVCEGLCKPELCQANNTCVDNRCALVCDAHTDCYPGLQDCVAVTADDAAEVKVCKFTGKAAVGVKCPFTTECDGIKACPNGGLCDFAQCGGLECKKDDVECGDDPTCALGLCPDKTRCIVNGCAEAECKPMSCLTTGVGDADAYCSIRDCKADTDCAGGYVCGITRDPHLICGTMKGNNNFCGKTSEACIAEADFALNGATYFEGSVCLLRKSCIKRTQCSPCESDVDCSHIAGRHCTDVAGIKSCTSDCLIDKDCDPDFKCVTNACVPRFAGGCQGTGKFCEPCQDDEDCGKAGTTLACSALSGYQKACFDQSFPDTCMTNADCPASPGGKPGSCLDESFGLSPADGNYHRCYFPYTASSNKFSCW